MSKETKKDWRELFPKTEDGKLNIYFHISENSGVGYYRQYLPAITLRDKGIANAMISDFKWGEGNHTEPSPAELFDVFCWADVIVVGRRDQKEFYAQWGGIREFYNVPIIMDTDDNVQFVRPTNPGYQGYHPFSEAKEWNKYGVGKTFDAITVTTQDLKDFYKPLNPKIYILPNSLDIKEWDKHEKKKFDDGFIRIGFIGSAAHTEGVNIIKSPILKILEKYPNTKFLITHVYAHLFKDWPEEIKKRIEFIPWISLQGWQKGMKDLGIDIGLAPLTDNMFNRAKSNLRWIEYGAAKIAPIVSPVKPYLCAKNGIDALFAKEKDEWFSTIESLVVNSELRYNISENAYKRISEEFDIEKNVFLWEKTYREIHDKFHEYFGAKKRMSKLSNGKYIVHK